MTKISDEKPFSQEFQIKEQLLKEIHSLRQRIIKLEENEKNSRNIHLQVEKALASRLAIEKLIASISTCFIRATNRNIDLKIQWALKKIGEFKDVDRIYVFKISPDGRFMTNTHEWCAEGISPQIHNLHDIPAKNYPWFMEKLNSFEAVYIPRTEDLPDEALAEKISLQSQNIKSLLMVPIFCFDRLSGFMGFDTVRYEKEWAEPDVLLLRTAGEIFSAAAARSHAEAELKKSEQRLRENEQYLSTLLETLKTGVVIIDAESHEIMEVNKHAAAMIGTSKENIIGKVCHEFICPAKPGQCLLTDLGQEIDNLEQILLTERGNQIPILKSVSCGERNGRKQLAECFTDISFLKNLLEAQNIDIGLSKNILAIINGHVPRYIDLAGSLVLFSNVISLSCHQEGGDHHFIHEMPPDEIYKSGKTLISLKDQSGHQVGCILRSILTDLIHQSIIHAGTLSLEETITRLNRSLMQANLFQKDDFFTSINCELNHENLGLRYVSCGHPGFAVIRDGEVFILPGIKNRKGANPPLAVLDNYSFSGDEFILQSGDQLLLYTDGLLEAIVPDETNKNISSLQLKQIIENLISGKSRMPVYDLMYKLMDKITGLGKKEIHGSGINQSKDDITLIGMEIEDKADIIEEIWHPWDMKDLQNKMDCFIDARLNEWRKYGFSKPFRLRVCFEEALVNAWNHAHKCDSEKPVTIRYRYGNDFHLEIIDKGMGFDMNNVPDPRIPANRFQESGRGIFMIRNYASRARWNAKGNHLTMCFKKEPNNIEKDLIRMAKKCLSLWNNFQD